MYQAIPPQNSCARAWVAACKNVMQTKDEGYNVIIDVVDPVRHDEADNTAIELVDKFLRDHDQNPVVTVANTIFPQALFDAHGSPEFYAIDHRDHDRLTDTKRWGRYFERMTRHEKSDGTQYNPLQDLIDKLKRQEVANVRYKAAYELAVYDPLKDGRSLYGTLPCLSFLSFKLRDRKLQLTAMYRNHTYITRCLGNLIGLGWLQQFIATQAGIEVGSLTVISTHAEIDAGNWGVKSARQLVENAASCVAA